MPIQAHTTVCKGFNRSILGLKQILDYSGNVYNFKWNISYMWNYWRDKYLAICSNNSIGGVLNWSISVLYEEKPRPCYINKWLDNGVQLLW